MKVAVISTLFCLGILTWKTSVEGVDLAQFGLPVCCYASVPFLHSPSEVHSHTLKAEEQKHVQNLEIAFNKTPSIRKFLFPMKATQESANEPRNKIKRALLNSTKESSEGCCDQGLNGALMKMPEEWKENLRRVLFQSVLRTNESDAKGQILWDEIHEAPFQVIHLETRPQIAEGGDLASQQSISVPDERISGVMVNTENGIELRTSEGSMNDGAESRLGECVCNLIHHGDTLLAYWSVGFSDKNLEYLIYPLRHNVPTPPIFEPFHTDAIIKPSPIDLNPLIASRSNIEEVPFQASLEFGRKEGPQGPRPPPPNPYLVRPLGNRVEHFHRHGLHGFPLFGPPFHHPGYGNGLFGQDFEFNRLPVPPPILPPIVHPPPLPPKNEVVDPLPLFNLHPQNPFPEQGNNGIGPVVHPAVLDPLLQNHPKSIQEILLSQNGQPSLPPPVGDEPLRPGPNPGPYLPPPPNRVPYPPFDKYPPRERPNWNYPGEFNGEVPPGPNSGIYPSEFDKYPSQEPERNNPPRDQVVRTRPPGIHVVNFDKNNRDGLNGRRQPGNGYINRGMSDRPKYNKYPKKDKEDCVREECFLPYKLRETGRTETQFRREYTNRSPKLKRQNRDGRISAKATEPTYFLKF